MKNPLSILLLCLMCSLQAGLAWSEESRNKNVAKIIKSLQKQGIQCDVVESADVGSLSSFGVIEAYDVMDEDMEKYLFNLYVLKDKSKLDELKKDLKSAGLKVEIIDNVVFAIDAESDPENKKVLSAIKSFKKEK